jgi:Flp pilus assembly protein TadD
MPKSRHHKHKHKNKPASLLRNVNVTKTLERANKLIEAGNFLEALDDLKELADRAPNRAEVFEAWFFAAMKLEDHHEILEPAIRLAELQPHVPEHHYNLISAYQQNILPALALQTGRYFVSRWPNLELGHNIHELVEDMTALLYKEAVKYRLPEDCWLEVMVLHERVQVALKLNQFEETRRLATQLIALAPNFPSSYNNRSLAAWAEGDAEAAIADAQRLLELEPQNVHALSNLTRFLRLTNRPVEAREMAERLRTAESPNLDVWTKKAEAFSYLADDATVLQIAEDADKADALWGKYADPFLMHLAGVAAARLGDEKKAQKLWQEALKRAPSLARARANLEDFEKPLGEGEGPSPFEMADWLPPNLFEDFVKSIEPAAKSNNENAIKAATRNYLQKHPQIVSLVPVLLERGDPQAREFALRLAQMAETSESLAALKDFMHSPNGPDKLRYEALRFLQTSGVVKNGDRLSFWSKGRQTEIMAMNYRVDDEPYEKLPRQARELLAEGIKALRDDDPERGEQFLLQALAEAPNSASIQYNLSLSEVLRGNVKKAKAMLQAITARHPKYVFAFCQLALIALANDRLDEALEIFNRISGIEHFHYEEFANYCKARMLYSILAEQEREAAQHWFDMWEQMLPDDGRLNTMRPLLKDSMFARFRARQTLAALQE